MFNKTILAGMFALSNMGQGIDPYHVESALKCPPIDVRDSVEGFCQHLMESDEHEEIFQGEGAMWAEELTKHSDEDIARIWPHIAKLYNDAEAVVAKEQAA